MYIKLYHNDNDKCIVANKRNLLQIILRQWDNRPIYTSEKRRYNKLQMTHINSQLTICSQAAAKIIQNNAQC
jgi:hypothetical protein